MDKFSTWKIVTLGRYKSAEGYFDALKAKGISVSSHAKDVMKKIPYAQSEHTVELVLASGRDLGLADSYNIAEADAPAATFGLYSCEAEAAVACRDQYLDQPLNEWLWFAMKAVADSDLDLQVFYVGRYSDGLWLDADCVFAGFRYDADTVRVWSRRPPVSAPAASTLASQPKSSQSLVTQPFALLPGNPRYDDAAQAYFRAKHMESSDGIAFLDSWKNNV